MAEYCYIVASPGELEHEVATAEPEFAIVAAGLETGLHLPQVSESQGPSVGLGSRRLRGLLSILSRVRIGAHCSHLLIKSDALGGRNRLLLLGPRKI